MKPGAAPGARTFGTLEELGRALLGVVKRRSRTEFEAMLPTRAEFMAMYRAAKPKASAERLERRFQENRTQVSRRFDRLQRELNASGVEVRKLTYVGLGPNEVREKNGLGSLKRDLAVIVQAADGAEWHIDVEEVLRWQGRWRLVDPEVEFEAPR